MSEFEFKVGDVVRLVGKAKWGDRAGSLLELESVRVEEDGFLPVSFVGDSCIYYVEGGEEIELVERVGGNVVNHPEHYTRFPVEVIEITEHLNFNRGNAVKYLCRAGFKGEGMELVDLRKALWYVEREIERVQKYDA